MTQTYREIPNQPGRFEPHNPGLPLWRIILCKAVTLLYDVLCRPQQQNQ